MSDSVPDGSSVREADVRRSRVRPMPAPRRFDIDDLLNRPGTYFNPDTEVLIVVDDSAALSEELPEDVEDGGEWVLVSDEVPVDEHRRDELLERLQARTTQRTRTADDDEEGLDDEDVDEELEPDPEDPYA
jgi:hypothetical protein